MPFKIVKADITKLEVDAIVNAANIDLAMGGGVCGSIFRAAGAGDLTAACKPLAPIKTGQAVITPGFRLPAKHVIHAAGPVYRGGSDGEEALLYLAYANSLALAVEHGCESIAFPLISAGIYGYPKDQALQVATAAIADFLADNDLDVTLAVFDKDSFVIDEDLLGEVESYMDEHYDDADRKRVRRNLPELADSVCDMSMLGSPQEEMKLAKASMQFPSASIEDLVGNLDEPFSETLFRLIDATGMSDAQIYKRANMDRRLFSKIRSNRNYTPSKPTVIALAIALCLDLDQTKDLLERAGFALSHSRKFDVIVEFFISAGKYDIFEINNVLFGYDQPILGG